MVLNFVGYINSASAATPEQKALFLNDFVAGLGYEEQITNEQGERVPNPESKAAFANRRMEQWIRDAVRAHRMDVAYRAMVIPELVL
jgi:hypothetical protein